MVQNFPVGIYDGEIFIARIEDGKIAGFDVLRPVTTEQLESMRDKWERADEYKDFWKDAVAHDMTEDSFEDWFDSVWDEEFDENDEEDFPGKDDSYLDYLDEEQREAADSYMEENGTEVGTWETSGWYEPKNTHSEKGKNFKKFDFVFPDEDAQKWAKKYVKSLK